MPWAYALPIALGVVTVVAVTVILVEVVPAFLDDLERDRREQERRRIARQRQMVPAHAVSQGVGTAVEVQQGTHGQEVRQRKGASSQASPSTVQADQGRYEIRMPTRDSPQHVLGASEFENDDDVPLANLHGRAGPAAPSEVLLAEVKPAQPSEASPSTPPLQLASTAPAASEPYNDPISLRTETTDDDDPFTDAHASPLAASYASFPRSKSPTLAPASPSSVDAPLPDLLITADAASDTGWVIPSTSPSLAGGSDDDGWSRLSDEDEFTSVSSRSTAEWAKLHARAAAL